MTGFSACSGVVIVTFLCSGCLALRDVKIIIPPAVEKGQKAVLRCLYDLEGEQLYTLQWYKGRQEFFRYTPREIPPFKQFPIKGLRILVSDSNDTDVVLDDVSDENSGDYSCEVTTDAPSFFSKVKVGVLQVVEVPTEDPVISGVKTRYRLGEVLKADCASRESRPAANLTWLANDRPVDQVHVKHHKSNHSTNVFLFSSHSGLRMLLNKQLFTDGALKIRCIARIYNIYSKSAEKSVKLEKQKSRPHSPRTTTFSPQIEWDSALAAERYPHTTLIFASSTSVGHNSSNKASSRIATVLVFCYLLTRSLR